ncbi:MAG: hypothetical protein E7661_05955 [Ruminococcaceae bacterium]|nr:hypothetical protein [Oscillospiraceae bacterium]
MAILSKRNKYLVPIQIIVSLVIILALALLSLGSLISIPTEKDERIAEYTGYFYSDYRDSEGNELGNTVEVGFLKLWKEAFYLIVPVSELYMQDETIYRLSPEDIYGGEGFLYLTYLIQEAFSLALYEGVAFLALLLCLLILPIYLFVCFIRGLVSALIHRSTPRTAYLKVTHCLGRALGCVVLLILILFFNPACTFGPQMPFLMWIVVAALGFLIVMSHVKHHSRDERNFLIFSQVFSLASCGACVLMMQQAQKAGFISSLYQNFYNMYGTQLFTNLWLGDSDTAGILVFFLSTAMIVCLCAVFSQLFHGLTRLCCIFNSKEKRTNDHLFKYGIFLVGAFVLYFFLLDASGEYAVHLTEEEHLCFVLAFIAAAAVLILEILHSVVGYFISGIDMVTRLELLSGYAENRMTMDEETYQAAVASDDDTNTSLPSP